MQLQVRQKEKEAIFELPVMLIFVSVGPVYLIELGVQVEPGLKHV